MWKSKELSWRPFGLGRQRSSEDQASFNESLKSGDRAAIDQVIDRYLPQVLRAGRGAGLSSQEAEDLAQETFLTFLEVLPRFEGRSHVRTFLFGILYRKISEARRAFTKDQRHESIDDVMESRFAADGNWVRPPAAADGLLRGKEIRAALRDCLDSAPAAQRMAFHLREVEGLSRSEICEVLGVSGSNLGVMLFRLRNRTRECLESKGIEEATS